MSQFATAVGIDQSEVVLLPWVSSYDLAALRSTGLSIDDLYREDPCGPSAGKRARVTAAVADAVIARVLGWAHAITTLVDIDSDSDQAAWRRDELMQPEKVVRLRAMLALCPAGDDALQSYITVLDDYHSDGYPGALDYDTWYRALDRVLHLLAATHKIQVLTFDGSVEVTWE